MIDAEMYGMIPRANTERRRSAPPEKMSRYPNSEPADALKKALIAVRVDARAWGCAPRAGRPRAAGT